MRKLAECVLGEPPIGRDLAAEDESNGGAVALVEPETIVARHFDGVAVAVVVERAHAGEPPHDVGRADAAA